MTWTSETPRPGLQAEGQPAGLAGTEMDSAFAYWRGAGGRRYLFHVLDAGRNLSAIRSLDAVVILAARDTSGIWVALWVGRGEDDGFDAAWRMARRNGAVSAHVYGQAADARSRRAVIDDLAARMMPARPYIPRMLACAA